MKRGAVWLIAAAAAFSADMTPTLVDDPRWKIPPYLGRRGGYRRPNRNARYWEKKLERNRKAARSARIARRRNRPKY